MTWFRIKRVSRSDVKGASLADKLFVRMDREMQHVDGAAFGAIRLMRVNRDVARFGGVE